MSLGKRLFNVARAELKDAARKLKDSTEELLSGERSHRRSARLQDEKTHDPLADYAPEAEEPPEVRKYYANLELPVGAPAAEVKAAYRRLMRRYHPDRHHRDPKREEVATELTTQLRTAYEGLIEYLEKRDAS